jgi:hypothetical protein
MHLLENSNYDAELPTNHLLSAIHAVPKNTAIGTTTFYPSRDGKMTDGDLLRSRLALEMIDTALAQGYEVFVVDGGSDASWRSSVTQLGAHVLNEVDHPRGILGPGRRQALEAAANSDRQLIAWVEPEKAPLIRAAGYMALRPLAIAGGPVLAGEANLIVPRREDELASYPEQQRFEEITGNLTVRDTLRDYFVGKGLTFDQAAEKVPYLDLWIGPRIMDRRGVTRFLDYDGKLWDKEANNKQGAWVTHDAWESIFVPVWQAIFDGKKVGGVAVPYVHPAEQTKLESAVLSYSYKRVEQLQVITNAARRFGDTYDLKKTA